MANRSVVPALCHCSSALRSSSQPFIAFDAPIGADFCKAAGSALAGHRGSRSPASAKVKDVRSEVGRSLAARAW
jgi:hypothetical protein